MFKEECTSEKTNMQHSQAFTKQSLMEVAMLRKHFPMWPDALFEELQSFILLRCIPTIQLPDNCRITLSSSYYIRSNSYVSSREAIVYHIGLNFKRNNIRVEEWRKNDHDVVTYDGDKGTAEIATQHWMSGTTCSTTEFPKFNLSELLQQFQAGLEECDDIFREHERNEWKVSREFNWCLSKAGDGILCEIPEAISKQIRIKGRRRITHVTINQNGVPTSCIFSTSKKSSDYRFPEHEEFKVEID